MINECNINHKSKDKFVNCTNFNMLRILIMSYYELKESLLAATDQLKKFGYFVDNFPLYQYSKDVHDKKANFLEMCLTKVDDFKPDIILYWYFGVEPKFFSAVKAHKKDVFTILFDWDAPYSLQQADYKEKCKFIDLAVVSCKQSVYQCLEWGCKDAMWRPPGFGMEIHKPYEQISEYDCDVSFCCTTLYNTGQENDQLIQRYAIVKALSELSGVKFNLYGPECLKQQFPKNYICPVSYADTNNVFNKSRINISTHIVGNQEGYVNERTILILGAGALLLVDKIKGMETIFKENVHCVYYESLLDLQSKVRNILQNYNEYTHIKSKGRSIACEQHSWNVWADAMNIKITEKHFDAIFYQKVFDVQSKNMWTHWLFVGRFKQEVPYKFNINSLVNLSNYASANSLKDKSDFYIYWHYTFFAKHELNSNNSSHADEDHNQNSKSKFKYFGSKTNSQSNNTHSSSNSNFSTNAGTGSSLNLNIDEFDYCRLKVVLKDLQKGQWNQLKCLTSIVKRNPLLKIGEIVESISD